MKEGSDELNFIKVLKFCASRDIVKKMKRQAIEIRIRELHTYNCQSTCIQNILRIPTNR